MLTRALLLCLCATAASAECGADQQTFMSCQIAGSAKLLEVCFDAELASYSYGRPGKPELTLQEPVATLTYTPWPGVGSAIWEEVMFVNGGHTYTVHGGFDRPMGDEKPEDMINPHFGGVVVRKGDDILVELSCDPATVDFAWGEGLFDAKQDLGLVWDDRAREWIARPD